MVDTVPGDSTGNVSVDVVTRKSRTSISPRTPDDLTSSHGLLRSGGSLSGDLEKGELSVDSVKFGAILSAESIATSLAAKPVRWSFQSVPSLEQLVVTWNPDLRLCRSI